MAFESPVTKVYNVLPPPREDLDEVLAILFTGPCQPSPDDLKRTPLLVRRNPVKKALEWLKLNHIGYSDIEISAKNLSQYPEDVPPVSIMWRESLTNTIKESVSLNDKGEEDGIIEGDCPFVVHGLTGGEMSAKSIEALKGIALKHWRSGKKVLRVGHSANPCKSYNNPSLYPQMFPWLFPYGLGGIG
ncbi:hypothetical protein BDZ94DRAFT_1172861, partial [Collybia nuda]